MRKEMTGQMTRQDENRRIQEIAVSRVKRLGFSPEVADKTAAEVISYRDTMAEIRRQRSDDLMESMYTGQKLGRIKRIKLSPLGNKVERLSRLREYAEDQYESMRDRGETKCRRDLRPSKKARLTYFYTDMYI